MNLETIQQNAVIQHRTICMFNDIIRSNLSSINRENLKLPFEVEFNFSDIEHKLEIKYFEKKYVLHASIFKNNDIASDKSTFCKYSFYIETKKYDTNFVVHKVEEETKYRLYMNSIGNIAEDENFKVLVFDDFLNAVKRLLLIMINEFQLA